MIRICFVCISFFIAVVVAGCQQPQEQPPPQAQQANEITTTQKEITVTINAVKTSEPISKYIYGQFIEHLGRSIYGGIWAEMLEDRKFYFPITANYKPYYGPQDVSKKYPFAIIGASPWQITGGPNSVVMVKEDSFVGEHTPLIQPDSGIRQLDLGLVNNKQYAGYIYLKARQQRANVTVSLLWGDKPQERDDNHFTADANEYIKYPLRFTAGADTTNGKLEIRITGGACFVGTVSLMPADNIEGMRADTLKLLKELNASLYRWPGGNFVSGYDWRNGIGERDKRAPQRNPAWAGLEHNDFGFNEFIHFCRLVEAEPLVTVNTGFGDAYSAAAQLEYANGSIDKPMGSLRAKNGDPEPFNVRYWCIGNEMYGPWQLGFMKLEHYVRKHNWIVDKMRQVDPNIVTIASGNAGSWSEGLLQHCSNHIDLIAEHFYCREKNDVAEHASQIADSIKHKAQFHRQLRQKLNALKGKDIRIAMTEWNYWYGPYLFGDLGTRYFHKDALGIARGLHEYFRNSDIISMASYAQTVNVIGCIKTSKTDAAFETTGLALKLYRNNFGTLPVAVTGDTGPLDVMAAWTSDKKSLTIAIVNPAERKYELVMDLQGVESAGMGKLWLIANSDPMAYNEPGKEPQVVIEEKSLAKASNILNIPPLSICLYKLRCKMKDYAIQPVSFTDVKLTDGLWTQRIETNRKVTIPHILKKCEETGRIDNFAIAGGLMQGKHRGEFPFDDTDIYKVIEGAAYSLSVHPDTNLDKYLDELITKIAAAQENDGYLYTTRTNNAEHLSNWFGRQRWEKLKDSHELYNMGHLYEAAVAHYQATGKRNLLDVAIKNADFLDTVFGPGKNQSTPGHQIIEMGLARLYRATGNEKYLKLAKFFLEARGPGGGEYSQSHKKPVDQTEAVGHAVRATYMYSGMADIAALTADRRYLDAINKIWDDVVTRKLYITGGIGARDSGEAFGNAYELPNASAYCETCAAIGNCFWNHRMFLLHGNAKYIDVLERTLYNALLSGISLNGDSFFYPNPLESQGQHQRNQWFSCACCPSNIVRFIPQVPGYIYAQQENKIYINLFVDSSVTLKVGNNTVLISQSTQYPWDGNVKITVAPERPGKFTLCIRIPGWAQNQPVPGNLYRYMNNCSEKANLKVNGKSLALNIDKGFACIERNWQKGDVIELYLPMPVKRVIAHEKVEDDKGKVALQRGPIVYCAEWKDNNGSVLNIALPDSAVLKTEFRKDLLNGVVVILRKPIQENQQEFLAIPYYAWANRGPGEMAVWLAKKS
jgi:DUF1680 family protein/alpha-L-arabinofuranosidase